ncbi:MAG: hypothetical protein Q4B26_04535 [Eubacteriales bacterium]|nr:hypothetical protein [Eubacteriales bacterium]
MRLVQVTRKNCNGIRVGREETGMKEMKRNVEQAVRKLFDWADWWERDEDDVVTEDEIVSVVDYLSEKMAMERELVYGTSGHYPDSEEIPEIDEIIYEDAVCIYSEYDSNTFTGDMEIRDDIELYLTVTGELYEVNCVSFEAGGYYVEHRKIMKLIEKESDLFINAADILMTVEIEMGEFENE